MNDVYINDHVRTPRRKGRPGGAQREIPPAPPAATVVRALNERTYAVTER